LARGTLPPPGPAVGGQKRRMAGKAGVADSPGLSPYEHSLVWKLLLKLRPTEEQYETLRFRCEGGWGTGSAAGPLPLNLFAEMGRGLIA